MASIFCIVVTSQNSWPGRTVTKLQAGRQEKSPFDSRQDDDIFSALRRPDQLWGTLSLPLNRCRCLNTWQQSGRCVKRATHLHLVPQIRMGATIPLLLHTPSRRTRGKGDYHTLHFPGRHLFRPKYFRPGGFFFNLQIRPGIWRLIS